MGIGAPSYDDAIKKCDELFPDWREEGGVDVNKIEMFIEQYTSVESYSNLDYWGSGEYIAPNYVTTMVLDGKTHAANAFWIDKNNYNSVIYCRDYSSSSKGDIVVNELQLHSIYVFE